MLMVITVSMAFSHCSKTGFSHTKDCFSGRFIIITGREQKLR